MSIASVAPVALVKDDGPQGSGIASWWRRRRRRRNWSGQAQLFLVADTGSEAYELEIAEISGATPEACVDLVWQAAYATHAVVPALSDDTAAEEAVDVACKAVADHLAQRPMSVNDAIAEALATVAARAVIKFFTPRSNVQFTTDWTKYWTR